MAEGKILNGVDVDVVEGLIKAVNEKPDLAKCEFRVNNEWIDCGHNRTTITGFYSACQEISHNERFFLDADEPPIMILPNGKSRRILFIFDDIKILYDYMFSYFGCQVNELYIIVEVM